MADDVAQFNERIRARNERKRKLELIGSALVQAAEAGAAQERGEAKSWFYAGYEAVPETGTLILRMSRGLATTRGRELRFDFSELL